MLVCVYCGNQKADWMLSCCGENHFEDESEHYAEEIKEEQEKKCQCLTLHPDYCMVHAA